MDFLTTTHKINESDFKNRFGFYKYHVGNVLKSFGVKTVEELREKAKADKYLSYSLFRFRGMGKEKVPGKLMREIYQIESKEEGRKRMILNNLGSGI